MNLKLTPICNHVNKNDLILLKYVQIHFITLQGCIFCCNYFKFFSFPSFYQQGRGKIFTELFILFIFYPLPHIFLFFFYSHLNRVKFAEYTPLNTYVYPNRVSVCLCIAMDLAKRRTDNTQTHRQYLTMKLLIGPGKVYNCLINFRERTDQNHTIILE